MTATDTSAFVRDRKLPTGESKACLKHRLLACDRWQDFVSVREGYKKNGVDSFQAWCMAAELFPRPGQQFDTEVRVREEHARQVLSSGVGEGVELSRPGHWPSGGIPSDECIQWVFEALGEVGEVVPADAPSAGAWNLFRTCKGRPESAWQFYSQLWSKTIRPGDGRERLEESTDKIEVLIERLEASLKEGDHV